MCQYFKYVCLLPVVIPHQRPGYGTMIFANITQEVARVIFLRLGLYYLYDPHTYVITCTYIAIQYIGRKRGTERFDESLFVFEAKKKKNQ